MGLAQSLDADILMIADNDPRTVSFYRRTAVDSYSSAITVTGAIRVPLPDGTIGAGGATLPQGTVKFLLQASQVGVAPKPGDRIVDSDGAGYQIDSRIVQGEGTWYEVTCLAEV